MMFMENLMVGSQIVISKNDISMKKIFFYFVLLAATVIATASCSKEEPAQTGTTQTGMVLHATVDQTAATRATLSDGDTWTFAFSQNDAVFVRNDEMSPDKHWMFTKGNDDFSCISAETTESATNWYAYFPQVIVYLFQQSGKKEDVAKYLYALSGSTASPTTGEDGLSIAMAPQVAILVIDNQVGQIDINIKNGPNSWVHSLRAKTSSAGFELVTEESKVSLLTTNTTGLYYIAVPAGVQLCIKNGDTEIRTTKEAGFTAGKYYELKVPTTGTATRKGDIDVKWVQLWADGPKFAEYNVGANSATDVGTTMTFTDATKTGADYVWGANWCTPSKDDMDELLLAAQGNSSSKVTCNYCEIDGKWGFKFTGKETGYEENSVFFPAQEDGGGSYGYAFYWSATVIGSEPWYMLLYCDYGIWYSDWYSLDKGYDCLVRSVLKN